MTEPKALIDTNVLVYAYSPLSNKHAAATKTLRQAIESGRATISVQNLVEFSRVMSEKLPEKTPLDKVRIHVMALSEAMSVFAYHADAVARALQLSGQYHLHFFDALLAATMEVNRVFAIVTENDRDFRKIPWLKVVNPFSQRP